MGTNRLSGKHDKYLGVPYHGIASHQGGSSNTLCFMLQTGWSFSLRTDTFLKTCTIGFRI